MVDLLALVSEDGLSEEELSKAIVSEYVKVCGESGLEIFQEKVLPRAFKKFGKDYQLLTKKVLHVIELAGDCKLSEIDAYLKKVSFNNPLEKSFKRLESLLIVYNEGKES
mgnify:FL=1